jgi:hypothetical protein
VPVCDACGRRVDEQHIRLRIERLELATRFRPIHISVLLIDAAPPTVQGDFFYSPAAGPARSTAGQIYFKELAKLAIAATASGAPAASAKEVEATLAEFQRRGFFLTSAVECPIDDSRELSDAIRRLAPTVLRRVQTSYRPKHVALISRQTSELIDTFRVAGWADRLILDGDVPFAPDSVATRLRPALPQPG